MRNKLTFSDLLAFTLHLPFLVLGWLPAFLVGRLCRCIVLGWREGF